MSHFSVMVITEEEPTNDILTKALMPYHEFECTGLDNEYVVNVDRMKEAREEYDNAISKVYVGPSGEWVDPYLDRFYREPTEEESKEMGPLVGAGCSGGKFHYSKDWGDGRGYRPKIHFIPDGFKEIEVPRKDVKSFSEFIEGWYGFKRLNDCVMSDDTKYGWYKTDENGNVTEVVDRTNPNKKWDWWTIGGRWSGQLLIRNGNGITRGDSAQLKDIDFEAMHKKRRQDAVNDWAEWESSDKKHFYQYDIRADETREQYIARREIPSTFAVLKYGEWHSRGDMGWWGCVHDEKECKPWQEEWSELFEDVSPEHWVTVIDCHI